MTDGDTDSVQEGDGITRTTAPMQEFTTSQVTTGIVVFLIGAAIVFGIPLLL